MFFFLIEKIGKNHFFIEPSVGTGAFYFLLPKKLRMGIDIDPKIEDKNIILGDYLKFDYLSLLKNYKNKSIVIIGNPPFGKNASLALKFINFSANFSNIIAFILPKTFKKDSILNKINDNLHLIDEFDLPNDSFIFENKTYNVPCVFQIWKKKENKRMKVNNVIKHEDFMFTNKEKADFAIRRVGVAAGKIFDNFDKYSPSSHYYIKCNIDKNLFLKIINKINWDTVKYNTAGNPSISKRELIDLYTKTKNL